MTAVFKTYTPIDNSVYLERPYASVEEMKRAIDKASAVQKAWEQTPINERKLLCSQAVDALIAKRDAISEELCWQIGRPIQYAGGELDGFEERSRYMIEVAEEALAKQECVSKDGFKRYIQLQALGTVFVIAPWNYPYMTAVNAIIPALLAGNTVILKHSKQTPLAAERLHEAFTEAGLPEGVFQYLHLTHQDTEKLICSTEINAVVFTGSVSAGKKIEAAASGRFISLNLELGGKDPAYVCADAPLDETVASVLDGAFFNSGQSCCGIERIYVHQDVFQPFVQKAIAFTKGYKLGRPDDPSVTIGPMINAAAADFVRGQLDDAIQLGGTVHMDSFSDLDTKGSAYKSPQIVTGVTHLMRLMNEETFGPIVGIMSVQNDAEAIELMNDSRYGLTAAVYSKDIERAVKIGDQLETGTFFVNRCDYLDPALAWTGVKDSGRGCSLSKLGFYYLTRPKSYHIKL